MQSEQKTVLYVHHAGSLGGAPRSLAYLITELDKTRYNPIVLSIQDGPACDLFRRAGAQVLVRKLSPFHGSTVSGMNLRMFLRYAAGYLPCFLAARKLIVQINPDLIHLNTTCLFAFAQAAKSVAPRVPVICHIREPLLDWPFGRILEYMNDRYADGFIAIDEYSGLKLRTNKKKQVIYNFINFDVFDRRKHSNCVREEFGLTDEDVVFLCLGRVSETNGTLELLKLALKMIPDNPRFHFIIAGTQQIDDYYNRLVEALAIQSPRNIHLKKFDDDVVGTIASSDVVVCPFTVPHFSRSIMEACAMGKPSIATNVAGLRDALVHNETGFLCNDSSEFEAAVRLLGQNREIRLAMGGSAYELARRRFDARANASQIFEFYDQLLVAVNEK